MPPRCKRKQGKRCEVRLQEGLPGPWGRWAAEGEARDQMKSVRVTTLTACLRSGLGWALCLQCASVASGPCELSAGTLESVPLSEHISINLSEPQFLHQQNRSNNTYLAGVGLQ